MIPTRKPGRPRKEHARRRQVAVHLSEAELVDVAAYARYRRLSPSEVSRMILMPVVRGRLRTAGIEPNSAPQ